MQWHREYFALHSNLNLPLHEPELQIATEKILIRASEGDVLFGRSTRAVRAGQFRRVAL